MDLIARSDLVGRILESDGRANGRKESCWPENEKKEKILAIYLGRRSTEVMGVNGAHIMTSVNDGGNLILDWGAIIAVGLRRRSFD